MAQVRVVEDASCLGGYLVYVGNRVELSLSVPAQLKDLVRAMRRDGPPEPDEDNPDDVWRDGDWLNVGNIAIRVSRQERRVLVYKLRQALLGVFDPADDLSNQADD